jgi:ribosomal protein L40E
MERHPSMFIICDTVLVPQPRNLSLTMENMRRPPATRDCLDCGAKDGMMLQNVAPTVPLQIPLLYVCRRCGALLTIPPPPSQFPRI